jgi:hypothetical protein
MEDAISTSREKCAKVKNCAPRNYVEKDGGRMFLEEIN